jgi:hypothetical protein
MNKLTVIIDPIANVYYAGFYIKALIDRFGKNSIVFSSKPFMTIRNRADNFNFVVFNENYERRYSIHFDDPYQIKPELYEWCDVYGHLNANFAKTPTQYHPKLISLVPSFGVRIWNLPQTIYFSLLNGSKVVGDIDFRKFIGKYRRQWEVRLPLDSYDMSSKSKDELEKYIFHLSTLWYSNAENKNDENVNRVRANFIRACRSINGVNFEGGFSKTKRSTMNQEFTPLIYSEFIPFSLYLEKIKQSTLVFNTPAFWNCHGWKLGEFLCLGKAIISTQLYNDLPSPLIHGEHIHYVADDEKSIKEGIMQLINDDKYRRRLEVGARQYWEKFGTPSSSLDLLGL